MRVFRSHNKFTKLPETDIVTVITEEPLDLFLS